MTITQASRALAAALRSEVKREQALARASADADMRARREYARVLVSPDWNDE